MKRLEKFLRENEVLKGERNSDGTFSIFANRSGIRLEGTCSANNLEGKILSKNGKPLYTISESCSEAGILRKLDEFSSYFKEAADFSQDDLERADPKKELLLDDADKDCEDSLTIDSVDDIVKIMKIVVSGATSVGEKFPDDIKSAYYGTISDLYNTIDNLLELSKYINDDVNESLSVPAKTDFIDDAINGISQACVQLKNSEEYKKLIGVLEDVKSELIISRE